MWQFIISQVPKTTNQPSPLHFLLHSAVCLQPQTDSWTPDTVAKGSRLVISYISIQIEKNVKIQVKG